MSTTEPTTRGPQRRRVVLGLALVLLLVVVVFLAIGRNGDDDSTSELTVTWGGSEGQPSCVHHPEDHTVEATITVNGEASSGTEVTVTVTAYADENTSQAVGSGTKSIKVEGTVAETLQLSFPVDADPHVDEDGVTACSLLSKY